MTQWQECSQVSKHETSGVNTIGNSFPGHGKNNWQKMACSCLSFIWSNKKKVNNHSLLKKKNKSQDDPFAASVVKDPLRTWNVPGFCYLTDFHAADRRWPWNAIDRSPDQRQSSLAFTFFSPFLSYNLHKIPDIFHLISIWSLFNAIYLWCSA